MHQPQLGYPERPIVGNSTPLQHINAGLLISLAMMNAGREQVCRTHRMEAEPGGEVEDHDISLESSEQMG